MKTNRFKIAASLLCAAMLLIFSSNSFSQTVDANFVFTPSSVTVEQGETFQVTVSIETDQPVSVADLNLTYDTDYVIANTLVLSGSELEENEANELNIDNNTGSITFGAFALENFPTSTFDFVTIEFLAVAETPTPTIVDHILTGVPRSEIAFAGVSILDVANTLEISITCPDSDDDGVCDSDDICPGGDDNADQDSDGIPDFCDNCIDQENPTAIAIDGDISDFGPAIGSDGSATYYFAADDQFFYVGVDGIDLDNRDIFIAIRTDEGTANSVVNGVDFTSEGWTYRVGFYGADDVCYFPSSDNACQQQNGAWLNYKGFAGNPVSELRMPRNFFGTLGSGSGNMEIAIWANNVSGSSVFSTFPNTNPTGTTDVGFTEYGSVSYPSIYQLDEDLDGFGEVCDCDDQDPFVNPNAEEVCDGIDNDCNEVVDDGILSADASLADLSINAGSLTPPFSPSIFSYTVSVCGDDDIDVNATATNPAATLSGLGTQSISLGANTLTVTVNACGITQDYTITVNAETPTLYYVDQDTDGFGAAGATPQEFCEDPGLGFSTNNLDCDDLDPQINPNAPEICDGVDNDCVGGVDDNVPSADALLSDLTISAGSLSPAFSPSTFLYTVSVCDDADIDLNGIATNPNASISGLGTQSISLGANTLTVTVNACGITQDYTITVNAETPTLYYLDLDFDGFGGAGATAEEFCEDPGVTYSTNNLDCDDLDPQINPNAPEICDGVDNDCDGDIDTDDSNFDDNINPVVTCESAIDLYLDENGQAILPVSLTALANSELDFSSTQGDAGWTYGVYPAFDASAFTQLSYDNGSNRYEGGQSFETPFMDATGGHPGVDNLITAVRRWTSDLNGPVSISGEFFDRNGGCGDGANVRIFKNADQIYEFLNIPTSSVSYIIDINVAIGDEIDFVIDPKFDSGCDDTEFTAIIDANTASATDDCSVSSLVADQTSFTCANLGSNTVVFTATDGSSNQGTCSSTVSVIDTISPVITCPTTLASYATDAGLCSASLTFAASATDNCSASVTYDVEGTAITFPFIFPEGTTEVTATAEDASGNTATCSFDVTVTDGEVPSVTAPIDVTASADAGICSASGVALGAATATDNCTSVTVTDDAPATFPVGMTTVTYTATDAAGNFSTDTQIVTVTDNEVPSVTAPIDVTASADAGICSASGVALGAATATDNCTSVTVTDDAPATFPVGMTTVTYTATDAAGNFSTDTQIVTVTDNEDPTITAPADVTTTADADMCSASSVALGSASAADNCPGVTVTDDAPATFPVGMTTVTYTATDAAGNFSTDTQIVTVTDNEDPNITAPADVTTTADADMCSASSVALGSASAADNCPGVTVTDDAPATFPVGMTTVTYTATDAAGNFSTDTQIVTVTDNEDPTITAPADVTTTADADMCSASSVALGAATATDNCTSVTVTDDAPATFPVGMTTVTYTATDAAGNFSTDTQIVTVTDNEDPTITAPADVTTTADADMCSASSVALGSASAADNCPGVTVTDDAPATFPVGMTTVTYTATDAAGNFSTDTQIVTVTDNEDPTITAPADVTTTADADMCSASSVALGSASAADNCPGVTVTDDAPATFPVGMTTVTYTATDAAGNFSTDTQIVTVTDNEDPTITAPADVTTTADADMCSASSVALGSASAADNCPGVTVTDDAPATFPVGMTTVTYTATDAAGNFSTDTQIVTVTDNEDPTITAPADVTTTADADMCSASSVALGSASASDNCPGVVITDDAPAIFPVGTTTVTYTATDASNNTSTATQTVTVTDDEDPITPSLADVTAECSATLTAPTTTDNCAGTITGTTSDPLSYSDEGTYAVTWNFDDGNGNNIDVVQNVIIDDQTDPVLLCPSNMTVSSETGQCGAIVDFEASANDNCGGTPTISYSQAPDSFFPVGTTTVTVTADDGNGNTSMCSFDVTVNDTEAPTISCPGPITVGVNQTNDTYLASGGEFDPTFSDNCSGVTVSHDAATELTPQMGPNNVSLDGWEFPVGTTTIRFTAIDASGNSDFCDVVINVAATEISGNVTLNGACLPLDMTVSVYEAGTPNPSPILVATFTNVQIASDGSFSFDATGIVPGSYDIYLKPENYLTKFAGNYPVDDLPTNITASNLVPGDISNTEDDVINGTDLSLIIDAYNSEDGVDAAYDADADVNCDGFVDALDLSLVIFFYFDDGDSPQQ